MLQACQTNNGILIFVRQTRMDQSVHRMKYIGIKFFIEHYLHKYLFNRKAISEPQISFVIFLADRSSFVTNLSGFYLHEKKCIRLTTMLPSKVKLYY